MKILGRFAAATLSSKEAEALAKGRDNIEIVSFDVGRATPESLNQLVDGHKLVIRCVWPYPKRAVHYVPAGTFIEREGEKCVGSVGVSFRIRPPPPPTPGCAAWCRRRSTY
jgi:hypothetical protein